MVQGKWFAPGSDLSQLLPVREAVFSRSADDTDQISWNVLVFQDDIPAASGRIWWEDGAYRLGEIGVLPSFRGRRLGDLVLRLLLFKAQSHYPREVRLSSPGDVSGFFARLGFRPDGNAASPEEMVLPGDRIELDSCKNCTRSNCPSRRSDAE